MEHTLALQRFNRYFARAKVERLMDRKEKGSDLSKNFGLSESEYNDLYDKLNSGDELLFEVTFMTHFEPAMKYLMNLNGASHDDAYDVVMNVLLEFRGRILAGKVKYGNLKFMFTQMCVQRYKREKGKKLDATEYSYLLEQQSEPIDEELYLLLDKSMDKLGERCQEIIQDVYYAKVAYKVLEQKYNTTAANLRKQKERCITKLKMNLRQALNNLK